MVGEERNEYSYSSKDSSMAVISTHVANPLAEHEGYIIAVPSQEVKVVDCTSCGYAHVVPLPDPVDVNKFYREKFYTEAKPNYFKEREEDKDWWDRVYREIFQTYNKLIGFAGRSFLDYGSGPGYMTAYAGSHGWKAYGVECSSYARDYCAQTFGPVNPYPTLADLPLPKFDAVSLYEVLEHVVDPVALLRKLRGVLAYHSVLSVVVPNDFNPLQMRIRAHAWPMLYWVSPVEHLNYFTKATLSRLLHKAGFKIEKITTTFPMEFFILMGDDYTSPSKPGLGRACHKKRILFEYRLGPELKAQLYSKFASMNIGREIVAYARKV